MSAPPLAYNVDELPIGRTKAYAEIAAGRLRAVKCGNRTLILADDLRDYLAALPAVTVATKRDTGAAVAGRQRGRAAA